MGRRIRRVIGWFLRALYWLGQPFWWSWKFILSIPRFLSDLTLSSIKAIRFQREKSPPRSLSRHKVTQPFYYDWIVFPSLLQQLWWEVSFEWWWGRQQVLTWFKSRRRAVWEKIHSIEPPPSTLVIPLVSAVLFFSTFVIAVYAIYDYAFKDLPSPYALRTQRPPMTTKIYDRNGQLLYTLFDEEDRVVVPLSAVSPDVVRATLAIEDDKFYEHWGISFKGIARAFEHNLSGDPVLQGGSTITQQLVKRTLLTPEKTFQRKVREAILAVAVDAIYSKDEILERYLNEVNYGGPIYGIEQASQWYFGKSAQELNLAESAFLAGLPVAPTAYSPFGPTPERAKQRQGDVLQRMVDLGYITSEQAESARQTELAFRHNRYEIKAPHFVMYVRDLLEKEYGEAMVTRGGLEVWTTLDITTQASAEASVRQELDRLARLDVRNGATLVTDPRSGEILAMVGSKDYFDTAHDGQVNVTLRPRQPGSSIKPVTYAVAFEHGYTPSTTIDDTPVVYKIPGSQPWAPQNYDGRFHGKVTLREALGSSYNIPAVRLIAQLGVNNVVSKGQAMGIDTWDDSSRFGFALTLGGGDVTMYDMAEVYGTFANSGYTVDLNPILQVQTPDGRTLYRNPCQSAERPCGGTRTVNPLAAYQITSILSDNDARTPAFGRQSVLNVPNNQVAVKTGTTNNLRDNWTIGYTTDRVVVTWVGNNDNTPMSAVASGITGASPIWRHVMDGLLAQRSTYHAFTPPTGFEKVAICQSTQTLPCAECPQVTEELYPVGMAPTRHCTASMFATPAPDTDVQTARR